MHAGFLLALLFAGAAHGAGYLPCDDAATRPALNGSLCARVAAPLSQAAGAGQVSLFIRKFPATGPRKGTLWLVAGGPGESGAALYPFIERLRGSFPGFDLLAPDHRGTGYSSRLCPAEEAVASPGGTALAGAEWGSCFAQLGADPARARQFTITNAAHDLRQLIASHQDGQPVYVYAVSYGTQLMLRALQIGRLPLTGMVLDSLVPMESAERWDLSRRSLVVDEVGRQVLARHEGEALYRRVLASSSAVPGGLPRLAGRMLDVPAVRERLPALLHELDRGGTAELADVMAGLSEAGRALGGYPQSPPSIPLVGIISNSENDLRPGLGAAAVEAEEAALLFSSPLPGLLQESTLPRYPRDRHFGGHPAWLPPTLVLSGTLDPKTHYQGALEHVAALQGAGRITQVAVTDAPHFILWTAPEAFARAVRDFMASANR